MLNIKVTHGHTPGLSFDLTKPVCVIGRSPTNEVVLQDSHVSGRHARVTVGLDSATLEDLGSTNGTSILRGDTRMVLSGPGDIEALLPGDTIELGQDDQLCRLRVAYVDDDKSATLVSVKRVDDVSSSVALQEDPITLRKLYEAETKMARCRDLDAILAALAETVFALVAHATHVTVVLRVDDRHGDDPSDKKEASQNYVPILTRTRDHRSKDIPEFVPITRSIYRKVLEERSAVLAADAPKDVGASASIMGASVRSTIALPLWRGDDILGVLQVDNRNAPGMLKTRDLDALLIVADHASLAISNGRLIKRLKVAEERLRSENRYLRDREQRRRSGDTGSKEVRIIGESAAMAQLLNQLDKVVNTNVTVLIEGETGTGKELIASAVHYRSRRRDQLFIAQNCAALAESLLESELFGHRKGSFTGATEDKKGLFEIADGATLFLDEITEAPMSIQSKLLRVLQEGEIRAVGAAESRNVNVRVVAATNRNLEAEVEAGRFREDLYYRLKVFPLRVPPLRERRSDIPLLIQHFLERYSVEIGKPVAGISSEAVNLLMAYDWPGNIRELQNEVQRMVIQVDDNAIITSDLLSSRMRQGEQLVARAGGVRGTLRDTMISVEKYLLLEALREHKNNKTNTARALGITREGLHKKLRQLDL